MSRRVLPIAGLTVGLLAGSAYSEVMPPVTRPATWSELQALPVPPPDRIVSYGTGAQQTLELRLPRQSGPHPVALLLHGGCWLNSFDRAYFAHLAEALRAQGWATFNAEYRRVGDAGGGWPGTFDDVKAAADFVLAHAPEWKLDAGHFVVVGHSAGGHMALLLAAQDQRVLAVVGLAAITDLAAYQKEANSCAEGARKLVGDAELRQADPMQQPLPAHAKIFLWSGDADRIVPSSYGSRYAARSTAIQHKIWPGAGHFDLVSPASVLWSDLLAQFNQLRRVRAARSCAADTHS